MAIFGNLKIIATDLMPSAPFTEANIKAVGVENTDWWQTTFADFLGINASPETKAKTYKASDGYNVVKSIENTNKLELIFMPVTFPATSIDFDSYWNYLEVFKKSNIFIYAPDYNLILGTSSNTDYLHCVLSSTKIKHNKKEGSKQLTVKLIDNERV